MQLIPLVHSQERNLQEMQTEFVETLAVNYAVCDTGREASMQGEIACLSA